MRTTQLPYEVEMLIRKDLHVVYKNIDELLVGGKSNHEVLEPNYLMPVTQKATTVPKTDPRGELYHFRKVRSVLEYIFEHDGMIRDKYRPMLVEIGAPSHVMALLH